VRTLLHATVYMFLHNLLNVLVQIANEMVSNIEILERFQSIVDAPWYVPNTQHPSGPPNDFR
jgi:hypothetical protein